MQKVILLISFIILILSTLLIFDDSIFFKVGIRGEDELEVIGQVAEHRHDVRRKLVSDFVWYPIKNKSNLYVADSIYTGENSTAKIKLKNSLIVLEENSLITIGIESKKLSLNIEKGSFVGDIGKNSKLAVKLNGKKREIEVKDRSQIKFNIAKTGEQQLAVLSGQLQVKVGEKFETVKKNTLLKIKKNGKIEKIKINLSLIEPITNKKIWHKDGSPKVKLKWSSDQKIDSYKITILGKSKRVVKKSKNKYPEIFRGNNFSEDIIGLSDGNYRWFVEAIRAKKGFKSLVYNFSIVNNKPVHLTYPRNQTSLFLSSSNKKKGTKVNFVWADKTFGQKYHIQVSRDRKFKKNIIDKLTYKSKVDATGFGEGKFYWRVKIEDPTRGEVAWSTISNFSIQNIFVEQIFPPSGSNLWSKNERSPVNFSFKANRVIDKYILRIKSEGFNKEITRKKTETPNLFKKKILSESIKLPQGRFMWSVDVFRNDTIIYGPVFTVNNSVSKAVDLLSPYNNTSKFILKGKNSIGNLKLDWYDESLAKEYQIQVANDEKFGQIILDKKVNAQEYIFNNAKEGSYFWRVKIVEKGRPSSWSFINKFSIHKLLLKIISPRRKGEIWYNDSNTVKFKFGTTEDFDRFDLNIFNKSGSVKKISEGFKTNTNKLIKGFHFQEIDVSGLPDGKISWSITAYKKEKVIKFTPQKFSKFKNSKLRLAKPFDNSFVSVSKSNKMAKNINFFWDDTSVAQGYKFDLSKDKSFKNILIDQDVKGKTLSIDELGVGKYYWRVRIQDEMRPKLGDIEIRTLNIYESSLTMKSPIGGEIKWSKNKTVKVDLLWTSSFIPDSFNLLIQNGNKLKAIKGSKQSLLGKNESGDYTFKKTIELAHGHYNWFVEFTKSGHKEKSQTEKFEISMLDKMFLLSPENMSELFINKDNDFYSNLLLKWTKINTSKSYLLSISKDENFKDIFVEESINRNSYNIESLPKGRYYWKVKNTDELIPYSKWSKVSSFSILKSSVELVTPKPHQKAWIKKNKGNIKFSWKLSFTPDKYILKVFKNKKIVKILNRNKKYVTRKFKNTKLFSEDVLIGDGDYEWFVEVYKADKKFTSQKSELFVNKLDAIKNILPSDNGEFYLKKNAETVSGVIFKWSPVKRSNKYLLEIATDKAFRKKIIEEKVDSLIYKDEDFKKGIYYWRVKNIDESVPQNKWSSVTQFAVTRSSLNLIGPLNNDKIWTDDLKTRVKLEWITSGPIDEYTVKIISKKGAKVFKRKKSKRPQLFNKNKFFKVISLSPGSYKWFVTTRRKKKVQKSSVFNFRIRKNYKVVPANPKNNKVYKLSIFKGNDINIKLSWKDLARRDKYLLEVSKDKKFKDLILNKEVEGYTYLLEDLDEGNYFWRLKPVLEGKTFKWGVGSVFFVINDLPINLNDPDDDSFELIDYKAKIKFEWEKRAGMKSYTLLISKNKKFNRASLIFKKRNIKNESFVVSFSKIGKFYWKVIGVVGRGIVTSSKKYMQFSAKMDLLPAPKLVSKKIKHTVMQLKFKGNKAIGAVEEVFSFEWKPIKGKKLYIIELYKIIKGRKEKILSEKVDSEYYIWDKISVGDFIYRIIPVDKFNRRGKSSDDGILEVSR